MVARRSDNRGMRSAESRWHLSFPIYGEYRFAMRRYISDLIGTKSVNGLYAAFGERIRIGLFLLNLIDSRLAPINEMKFRVMATAKCEREGRILEISQARQIRDFVPSFLRRDISEVCCLSTKRQPSNIHVALIQNLAQAVFQKRCTPFLSANAIHPSRSFKIPKVGIYNSARLFSLFFWRTVSQGFSNCFKKVQPNFAP